MKITFILPAIGKKPGQKYIGTWKMEPLTIAVLKALTPPDIETELFDDRIELIDYETKTDLVCITTETYTAKRCYRIAEKFRSRGIPVVMGGYHVTMCPEEAAEYCDSVMVGNAETVWKTMLDDVRNNRLQKIYHGGTAEYDIQPDKSIFTGKKYLPVSLVETGRGCIHNCEFCSISKFYCSKYYCRSHDLVADDIKNSPHKYFFLVDDNLVADHKNAMVLFEKIAPLNIKWAGQGTLSMAKNPELLKAMKKSGCEIILIGFESLNKENLQQMNKSFNYALGERDELVKRVHDAGIGIYATFVFGYDNDDESTVQDALEFAKKHNFYTAAFNHLLPFPNTALYNRLKESDRLIYDKWWLADGYHYGELSFRPEKISAERLSELCRLARKEFSAPKTVLSRGFASLGRTSPLMWGLFWGMNLRLGEEIDQKMYVPIGENLDELPK
ncbi:MAG: B12-binding domain-containing radical SAM protein [Oscillospiraceae bacterium]|nr:B12-binding domain-containing radical SAM protein [Oscillospiraceae bacterium]